MSIPSKQRAIVGLDDGSFTISDQVNVPKLEDDIVLVRTKAVGLNPIDTKMKGRLAAPGCVAGKDFAGESSQLGPNVKLLVTSKLEIVFVAPSLAMTSLILLLGRLRRSWPLPTLG